MDIISLVSYQGDSLWTLDVLINLLIKSSLLLLAVFVLIRKTKQGSAIQQQLIWRLGFGALLLLGLSTYCSLWELQVHETSASLQDSAITPHMESGEDQILFLDSPRDASSLISNYIPSPAVSWDRYLQALWLLGFLLIIGKAFFERGVLKWVRRSGVSMSDDLDLSWLSNLLKQLNLTSPPLILVSTKVQIPMTFGWVQPTILLPLEAEEWEMDKLQQVILHELVHIQRKDYLFHGLSVLVQSIYWFNPLVWKAGVAYRIGSEWACDETVVLQGIDKFSYAENLLAIAANHTRKIGQIAFPFAKVSDLQGRIKRLLVPSVGIKYGQDRQRLIVLAVLLVLGIGMSFNLRSIGERPFSAEAYQATLAQLQSIDEVQKIQALTQLGKWGQQKSFYTIKGYVSNADTEVQKAALWALQQIGCLPAFCLISQQLTHEKVVLRQYAQALLQTYDRTRLHRYITDNIDKPAVQNWLGEHLEQVRQSKQSQLLAQHLAKGRPALQEAIWQVLQQPKHPSALHQLQQLLNL